MMRLGWALVPALALLADQAPAQVPLLGTERPAAAAASYTGPGDIVSGATAWYSCTRAYNAAKAAAGVNACTIRRASDNTTTTLTTQANGSVQSGASFCTSTTCYATEAYDQTGNGYHLPQGNTAAQPSVTLSCVNSVPCLTGSGVQYLAVASGGPTVSQTFSVSYVARRTGATSSYGSVFGSNASTVQAGFNNAANGVFIYAQGAAPSASATDNVWHAVQNIFNSASSTVNVDGSSSTVNPGTAGVATSIGFFSEGDAFHVVTGNVAEMGLWPSGFSSGNQTSLCENQQAYYGAGNFGATC